MRTWYDFGAALLGGPADDARRRLGRRRAGGGSGAPVTGSPPVRRVCRSAPLGADGERQVAAVVTTGALWSVQVETGPEDCQPRWRARRTLSLGEDGLGGLKTARRLDVPQPWW